MQSWRTCAAVLRRVTSGRAASITAMSVTGCGNGGVFLGADDQPIRAGILSSDTRAAAFVNTDRRRTRQTGYPGQTASLLRWLRAREPRTARRLRRVLFWKDFIRLRLTGEACTDFTDAGASGLLDVKTRRWLRPDVVQPSTRESLAPAGVVQASVATATGLRAGTPVFTGCIDCEAGALGSGVRGDGEFSLVAGTWSINQTFRRELPAKASPALFLCNPSTEPGRWLWLEGSPTSAANFDWAVRLLLGRDDFTQACKLAEAAKTVGETEAKELLFIPRVPGGRGEFVGLRSSHSRGDLLRAVMTGVAFAHRVHVERLEAAGASARKVRLAGGATRSAFWCQLFADALGCPVEIPRGIEIGALGAAMCAGVGAGAWSSLAAAQRELVAVARVFRPRRPAQALLAQIYPRFLQHWNAPSP